MPHTGLIVCLGLLLVATLATTASGDPPRPGTTDSPLNESEEATLWSNQSSDGYVTNEEYRGAYDENRTTIHEIANGTDLTFTEPPATALRWTRWAHREFEPGDSDTSRHPPTANRTNGTFVKDAHVTVFSVSPSTHAYVAPGDRRYYVAPEGKVLALVDYRVEGPPSIRRNLTDDAAALDSHEVSETRLYADGEEVTTGSGSHWPALEYAIDDADELTIEADIEVAARFRTDVDTLPGGNATLGDAVLTETVTVSDSVAIDTYDLRANVQYADYPNGEAGASIYQTEPWQGYTLDTDEQTAVRGVWRFFTARDTDWDRLNESTRTGSEQVDSSVLPVFVNAYPSRLGPRAKPEHGGPEILETWGERQRSPQSTLPANVSVEVVEEPYEPTYGLAVRSRSLEPESLTVHGIVRGTEAELIEPIDGERSVRESSLSAEIVTENETGVTVLLTLKDSASGDPIVLADDDRKAPIANLSRDGYVAIDGQRVKTNATGEAVVHVTEQGVYTARYQPASWLESHPAYAGDSAVVRWHALATIEGWLELAIRFGLLVAPFGVLWYAGRRLGSFLHWRDFE